MINYKPSHVKDDFYFLKTQTHLYLIVKKSYVLKSYDAVNPGWGGLFCSHYWFSGWLPCRVKLSFPHQKWLRVSTVLFQLPTTKGKKKWKNWRQKKNLYIFGIFFRKYMGMNDITQLIFLIFNNLVAYIEIQQNQASHQYLFSIYKGQDTMLRARKMQKWGSYVLISRRTH